MHGCAHVVYITDSPLVVQAPFHTFALTVSNVCRISVHVCIEVFWTCVVSFQTHILTISKNNVKIMEFLQFFDSSLHYTTLSVFLIDTNVERWWTHSVLILCRAALAQGHSALSDVVRRGLSAAGIPSMLEPPGFDRGDGKRPDGITVYPYSRGRFLIWDATCFNTFASSNIMRAALAAGSVADAAEVRKIAKYAVLGRRFIFQPVAVETSGAMGKSAIQFLKIWAADLLCDFRNSARVISCSRECLWLLDSYRHMPYHITC